MISMEETIDYFLELNNIVQGIVEREVEQKFKEVIDERNKNIEHDESDVIKSLILSHVGKRMSDYEIIVDVARYLIHGFTVYESGSHWYMNEKQLLKLKDAFDANHAMVTQKMLKSIKRV